MTLGLHVANCHGMERCPQGHDAPCAQDPPLTADNVYPGLYVLDTERSTDWTMSRDS